MKDKHITDILDNAPLASLSEHDLRTIRAHVSECVVCDQAYRTAQLAELLVKNRAAEEIEPSPFFQTRVMTAWREQQSGARVPAFTRLWKTAGALVSSLALTTAALAALTFTIPEATQTSEETSTAVESMVLDAETEGALTEEQMLSAMYVDDEGAR